MWNEIYRKLWIVILLPLVAGGAAWYLTWEKSGSYRSVAIVEANIPEGGDTLKDIRNPDEYFSNLAAAMKRDAVTSLVSYRLLLHDLDREVAFRPPAIQYTEDRKRDLRIKLERQLGKMETLPDGDPSSETITSLIRKTGYDLEKWLQDERLLVAYQPPANEIRIEVSSEDPFLSAFTANTLAQEYIRLTSVTPLASEMKTADSTGYWRNEVERLRRAAEEGSARLAELKSRRPSATTESRVRDNRVAELEMKVVEEEWEVNNLKQQIARLGPTAPPKSALSISEHAKIQAIRRKIDQLNRIYKDGGSRDGKLDSTINALAAQLKEREKRLRLSTQDELPNEAERDMLLSRLERHENALRKLRADIQRLNSAPRRVSTNTGAISKAQQDLAMVEDAYEQARTKLRSMELARSKLKPEPQTSVSHLVLETKALPSARPEVPNALWIILGAFLGTMVVTVALIAIRKPPPPPDNDIFLRVNYANQRRMMRKPQRKESESAA